MLVRFASRTLLLTIATLISAIAACAQMVAAPEVGATEFLTPAATISKSVDEVNLAFTVTDKHGRFIGDLGPSDFRLLDDHLAPERLTFFQQRSDLPLHLAVLIDASSSVEHRFRFETGAAASFLKSIVRPGKDKALIVTFNDSVKTVVEPTDKTAQINSALNKLKPAGNTALHEAVVYACNRLRQIPETQVTRRAIILISDGVDTVHRSSLKQAEQEASRSEVMIFSLSTNYSKEDVNGEGDEVLGELSASTGGTLLRAQEETQLHSALRMVEKALHNQYVLAYTPAAFAANGKYRSVELTALKRGLRANCRRGYFAKPAER